MSAWATLNTWRRSTRRARSRISAGGIPEAQAAAIRAPMLDPTTRSGVSPPSSRARNTPMWASPLRPPPLNTRENCVVCFTLAPTDDQCLTLQSGCQVPVIGRSRQNLQPLSVRSEDHRAADVPGFPGGSAFAVVRDRWRTDWFFRLGLVLVALVVCAAAFAPWLAPYSPVTGDLQHAYLLRPGARFLLGTDTQGRDVLSRVLYGARLSLLVGVISQAVAVSLGVLLGLVAGYYQRWVDAVVMRLADVTLAFPTLLLLIAVAAAVRPSLPVIFVVIGVV